MTTSTKAVSWTNEMVATLTEAYTGDNSQLQTIADQFNKSVPMVRSKLVNLGLYKVAAKKTVGSKGGAAVRKLALVQRISERLGTAELTSLEKGSKADLELLLNALSED